CDAFFGQRILVARLRGGQEMKILQPFVADERLWQFSHAVNDIDEIEDHAPLGAQHPSAIAKAAIEIDDDDLVARVCDRSAERRSRGRLADATFTCRHNHDPGRFLVIHLHDLSLASSSPKSSVYCRRARLEPARYARCPRFRQQSCNGSRWPAIRPRSGGKRYGHGGCPGRTPLPAPVCRPHSQSILTLSP